MEESKLGEVLKGIRGFPLKLREKLGWGVGLEMCGHERNEGWNSEAASESSLQNTQCF